MQGTVRVIGRGIDGIKLYGGTAGIDEVVPGTCRYEDNGVLIDIFPVRKIAFVISHHDKPVALFDPQKLIHVRMHFKADFIPGIYAHKGKLKMFSGPQRHPESVVA